MKMRILRHWSIQRNHAQKRTAGNEQNVNFCSGWPIGLEIGWGVWYNINTEKKRCTQAFGMPEELPTSDAVRGHAEISADDSDERSTMVWVS